MELYTIGFTQKSARRFFELIKANNIKTLLDIRLSNNSQLAGFSKGGDLEYFLSEICGCGYRYEGAFAPTKELMDRFKAKKISAAEFEREYRELMEQRDALACFEAGYFKQGGVCLLCSEAAPDQCHRRVLAEMLREQYPTVSITHL